MEHGPYYATIQREADLRMNTDKTNQSEAWKDFVNTAQSILTAIQTGGTVQVSAGPYLSDLDVRPVAPNRQNQTTLLLIGGGVIVAALLLIWGS